MQIGAKKTRHLPPFGGFPAQPERKFNLFVFISWLLTFLLLGRSGLFTRAGVGCSRGRSRCASPFRRHCLRACCFLGSRVALGGKSSRIFRGPKALDERCLRTFFCPLQKYVKRTRVTKIGVQRDCQSPLAVWCLLGSSFCTHAGSCSTAAYESQSLRQRRLS